MNINDNMKALKDALGTFEDMQQNNEKTFIEAMNTAKGMEDSKDKDWLVNSLNAAKEGNLTVSEFTAQIKARGYGS